MSSVDEFTFLPPSRPLGPAVFYRLRNWTRSHLRELEPLTPTSTSTQLSFKIASPFRSDQRKDFAFCHKATDRFRRRK